MIIVEEWVRNTLSTKLNGDNIMLTDLQEVSISVFCTFFRTAIEDETQTDKYIALSGSHTFLWGEPPQEYTRSAMELGYQQYFDYWHAEGLI